MKRKITFSVNNEKKLFEILLLIISFSLTYILFLSRFISIIIFYSIKKSKVSLWVLISYSLLLTGSILYLIIFGTEPFISRLSYNLMLSSISLFTICLIYIFPKLTANLKSSRLLSRIVSTVLVVSTFMYLFTMNIRTRPIVQSLQEGHDEYLAALRNYTYADSAPNVLVIVMDDMGYSDISSYSYLGTSNAAINTPNIDSIGEDGVFMDNFYSSCPVCSPSRFGIMTGRYNVRGYIDRVLLPTSKSITPYNYQRFTNSFFFENNVDGILADEITVAEAAQAIGYNTAMIGKWHLGDYGQYLPTNQGFDYFYGCYYSNDMTPYNIVREQGGKAEIAIPHKDIMKDQSEVTSLYTEEMMNYLENTIDNNEKFFAFYTSPWPHGPIFSGEEGNTSDDNYISCIEEFDDYLGNILDLLKDKNVYNDTLIIFTSDNGPAREGSAGALRGRKGNTFEGGQKVPMIACYVNGGLGNGDSFNGITGAKHIESSAMNIDLFPTILQYIGIDSLPRDREIDGVSLYGVLQGDTPSNAKLHHSLYYMNNGQVYAVQKPYQTDEGLFDFKYFDSIKSENTSLMYKVKNYLVNLDKDPNESYNLSNVYPDAADELKADLNNFIKELKENRRGIKP